MATRPIGDMARGTASVPAEDAMGLVAPGSGEAALLPFAPKLKGVAPLDVVPRS